MRNLNEERILWVLLVLEKRFSIYMKVILSKYIGIFVSDMYVCESVLECMYESEFVRNLDKC